MPRPIACITNKSGRTIAVLVETAPSAITQGLPSIPAVELKRFLSRAGDNPIKALRQDAGISQADLASALGISQPMISKLERPGAALSKPALARARSAIEAILESRRRWTANPPMSYENLLAIQAPILELAARRKPRDPVERALLSAAGDRTVLLESEKRTKRAGERAIPPRRNR